MKTTVMTVFFMAVMFLSGCGGGNGGGGPDPDSSLTELEGTWNGLCNDQGNGTYAYAAVTFSKNTFILIGKQYGDSACTGAGSTFYTSSGTFVVGSSVAIGSGGAAKEFDTSTLKENGEDVIDKEYDIFSIDNGRLYFGLDTSERDGSSAAKRPNELNFDDYFTKQTGTVIKPTELEGTWSSQCEDLGEGIYGDTTVTFSGNTFSFTGKQYSDSACTAVDSTLFSGSGTFVIGNSVTLALGGTAKELDRINLKEDGVDVNNKEYDIFRIDNGKLYFGLNTSEKDGSSAAKRPNELDFDMVFTIGGSPGSNVAELEGTWTSVCLPFGEGTSVNLTRTISGNIFTNIVKRFSDSACTAFDSTFYSSSGTIVIGDSLTTGDGWTARQLDVTVLKEDGVDVNFKNYDIYSIDTGTLYFGLFTSEKDGSSADKRPVDLDFEVGFTKG